MSRLKHDNRHVGWYLLRIFSHIRVRRRNTYSPVIVLSFGKRAACLFVALSNADIKLSFLKIVTKVYQRVAAVHLSIRFFELQSLLATAAPSLLEVALSQIVDLGLPLMSAERCGMDDTTVPGCCLPETR